MGGVGLPLTCETTTCELCATGVWCHIRYISSEIANLKSTFLGENFLKSQSAASVALKF